MSRNATQVRVRLVVLPDTCDSAATSPACCRTGAWPQGAAQGQPVLCGRLTSCRKDVTTHVQVVMRVARTGLA